MDGRTIAVALAVFVAFGCDDEDAVADPCRLRRMNEIQHRVTGHLLHLLQSNPERYPDDVLMSIILDDSDSELMWAFKQALKTIDATS